MKFIAMKNLKYMFKITPFTKHTNRRTSIRQDSWIWEEREWVVGWLPGLENYSDPPPPWATC